MNDCFTSWFSLLKHNNHNAFSSDAVRKRKGTLLHRCYPSVLHVPLFMKRFLFLLMPRCFQLLPPCAPLHGFLRSANGMRGQLFNKITKGYNYRLLRYFSIASRSSEALSYCSRASSADTRKKSYSFHLVKEFPPNATVLLPWIVCIA